MQTFLQLLFAQSIQTTVEQLLQRSASRDLLSYLRCLGTIHQATVELVDQLKQSTQTVLHSHASSTAAKDSISMGFEQALLRCRDDLFVQLTENDKYMEKETRSLINAFQLAEQPFTDYTQARRVAMKNRGMFTKLASAATTAAGTAPLTAQSSAFIEFSVMHATIGDLPAVELVRRMVSIQQESMDRCRELSPLSDCAKNASALFSLFLDYVGHRYLGVCLDM
jgi:hypothetical protein